MTCPHCNQTRPHIDRGEYYSCFNCGHHQFKEEMVAMPDIPPPERKYNMNQNKLGQLTMQNVVNNLAEIKAMRKKKMSWFAVAKELTAKTAHSMHPRTVQKYYERACA